MLSDRLKAPVYEGAEETPEAAKAALDGEPLVALDGVYDQGDFDDALLEETRTTLMHLTNKDNSLPLRLKERLREAAREIMDRSGLLDEAIKQKFVDTTYKDHPLNPTAEDVVFEPAIIAVDGTQSHIDQIDVQVDEEVDIWRAPNTISGVSVSIPIVGKAIWNGWSGSNHMIDRSGDSEPTSLHGNVVSRKWLAGETPKGDNRPETRTDQDVGRLIIIRQPNTIHEITTIRSGDVSKQRAAAVFDMSIAVRRSDLSPDQLREIYDWAMDHRNATLSRMIVGHAATQDQAEDKPQAA